MSNNEWNFEKVYSCFQPKIHRYLTRVVGSNEAEDLVQEVFIKVDKALVTFRSESQLSTWIYRIATNVAIDRMRSSSYQRKRDSNEDLYFAATEHTEGRLNTGECSLEAQAIQNETRECIRGIIEKLPENYRLIVILSELEGLRNKEIAEILNLDSNVVKTRLHRGRTRLKEELLHNCCFSWDERNEFTCEPNS